MTYFTWGFCLFSLGMALWAHHSSSVALQAMMLRAIAFHFEEREFTANDFANRFPIRNPYPHLRALVRGGMLCTREGDAYEVAMRNGRPRTYYRLVRP